MLARYLKAQLTVLLFGGIVGPIFLVVYFAIGQISLLQWMFYVGLLITVADVLIALWLTNYGAQSAAKSAELEQHGVLALAQITGLTETGTRINEQPLVKVNLHISGPGLVPFDSQDRVIASITRLGNLTARKLVVLVNPTTQEYQIDWERSALVNGLMPAQFAWPKTTGPTTSAVRPAPLMEILQLLKANSVPLERDGRHEVEPGIARADPGRGAPRRRPTGAARSRPPLPQPAADRPAAPELETLRAKGR